MSFPNPTNPNQPPLAAEAKGELVCRTKTVFQALELITQENALVKTVSSPVNMDTSWTFLLNQFLDPVNSRPVKQLNGNPDRTTVWNPLTGEQITNRKIGPRGAPKPHKVHTKKEAVTLLPSNGKCYLYSVDFPVGLMFNLEKCDLKKEKYTWLGNIGSNERFWVGNKNNPKKNRSVGLQRLRQYLRECVSKGQIPKHNELLVGLAKDAISAVFAPVDDICHRLNALRIQRNIKAVLGIESPLLILTPQQGPKEYSLESQLADIERALQYQPSSPEYKLLLRINPQPQQLAQEYKTKIEANKLLLANLEKLINEKNEAAVVRLFSEQSLFHIPATTLNRLLLLAITHHLQTVAKTLLVLGASVDYYQSEQEPDRPLSLAIKCNCRELVSWMLEHQKVKLKNSTAIPQALSYAVTQGRYAEALQLLNSGIDFDIQAQQFSGPMNHAVESSAEQNTLQLKLITALFEKNAFYNLDLRYKPTLDFLFQNSHRLARKYLIMLLQKNLGDNPREFLTFLIQKERESVSTHTLTQIIVTTPELGGYLDFSFLTQFFSGESNDQQQKKYSYLSQILRLFSTQTLPYPLTKTAQETIQQCAIINHLENKIKAAAAQNTGALDLELLRLLYQNCYNQQILYALKNTKVSHLIVALIQYEIENVTTGNMYFLFTVLQNPLLNSQLSINTLNRFFSDKRLRKIIDFKKLAQMLLSAKQRALLKPEYALLLLNETAVRKQLSPQNFQEIFDDVFLTHVFTSNNLEIFANQFQYFLVNEEINKHSATSFLIFVLFYQINISGTFLATLFYQANLNQVESKLNQLAKKSNSVDAQKNVLSAKNMIGLYHKIRKHEQPDTTHAQLMEAILQTSIPNPPETKDAISPIDFASHKTWVEQRHQLLNEMILSFSAQYRAPRIICSHWQELICKSIVTTLDGSFSQLADQAYLTGMLFLKNSVVFKPGKKSIGLTNIEQLANNLIANRAITHNFVIQRNKIASSTLSSADKIKALLHQSRLRLQNEIILGKITNNRFKQFIDEKVKMRRIAKLAQLEQNLRQTKADAEESLAQTWFAPIYALSKDVRGRFNRNQTAAELEQCLTILCATEQKFLDQLNQDLVTWIPHVVKGAAPTHQNHLTKIAGALRQVINKLQAMDKPSSDAIHSAYQVCIGFLRSALLDLGVQIIDLQTPAQIKVAYEELRKRFVNPVPPSVHRDDPALVDVTHRTLSPPVLAY